ncbi:MAG: indole-3-glycerol phosphate synthase TrpC [Sedimentisphaerales bacterium]|nr:indole-3-glycerol phosphate synthase TrpC [Sedimentisphaerales bacterium]
MAGMSDILEKILAVKRNEIDAAQERISMGDLQKQAAGMPRCRNFYQVVSKKNPRGLNVIAEIKKASPSAGLIRTDFDPVKLAQLYAELGADAISVLTDESFFQGHLDYLRQVKAAVELPVLRKDFIIDPYQVYEARAAGADAILLIAEALEPGKLMDLLILAQELTLSVLLEVHEMESLLQLRSLVGFPLGHYTLLGINNRNLKTMQTDLGNSLRLAELVDNKHELVSESGIKTRTDVERLMAAGFGGILIGETLMRADDIAAKFNELFATS